MNQNFEKIKELGFDVVLKENKNGWAYAYLFQSGKKIFGTPFRHNRQQCKDKDFQNERVGTHLDLALARLIEKHKIGDYYNDDIPEKLATKEST